ncbi:MAG: hypothetical protein ABWY52_01040 [Candidatus Limnocylindrales bacterium]
MRDARFAFAPGLDVAILGQDAVVEAFRREYAPREVPDRGDTALEIEFARLPRSSPAVTFGGRHKSVAWRVAVSPADASPTRMVIDLLGVPISFARSLVQGYVVEPMLSVIAAEHDRALVPGAGVADERGLTLVLGRSGAGKSTLMARLAATGHAVLGDDQLLVDGAGMGSAFPRRLRFYPDIETTAPEAYARMPISLRRRLRLRKALATASRGFIRPSLGVDRATIGARWVPGPLAIGRVVLLERGDHNGELRDEVATTEDAVTWAARLHAEQRARLNLSDDPVWRRRLAAVEERERTIELAAFSGLPVARLVVPHDRPASDAIAAVAEHLGFAI